MLTKKQRDLLAYIHERMSEEDVPPSFDEMKEALGLKSKSGIHRLITALVERGYIERLPHRARALSIKRLPPNLRQSNQRLSNVSQTHKRPIKHSDSALFQSVQNRSYKTIPLFGKIAAGTPIEALRDEERFIDVSDDMLGTGEHYALTISGDSMINAGIHDGDIVIIQRSQNAENGQIVVALVDKQEATLKRLKKEGPQITLIPENDTHTPQILAADRVEIQGKLKGLIRRYH